MMHLKLDACMSIHYSP